MNFSIFIFLFVGLSLARPEHGVRGGTTEDYMVYSGDSFTCLPEKKIQPIFICNYPSCYVFFTCKLFYPNDVYISPKVISKKII